MAEQLQRVPRPASALDIHEGQLLPARGVNRSNLTLWFSIGALVISSVSATIELIPFFNGGQRKAIAEAVQAEVTSKVKEVDSRWAERLHDIEYAVAKKDVELRQADITLRQEQLKTQRTEQRKNIAEGELASEQQGIAERDRVFKQRVLNGFNIEQLGRTVDMGLRPSGSSGGLLYPPGCAAPFGLTQPGCATRDPLGNVSNIR